MDPLDAYRCAKILLNQHGDGAAAYAMARACELQASGDAAGQHVWIAISAALEELRRLIRQPSDRLKMDGAAESTNSVVPLMFCVLWAARIQAGNLDFEAVVIPRLDGFGWLVAAPVVIRPACRSTRSSAGMASCS